MKHGFEKKCNEVALGLGGNIGCPRTNLSKALSIIDATDQIVVRSVSQLYETPPWGDLDQPKFLNACALIKTSFTPHEVLDFCLGLELEMGRKRERRWGPRTIDIDVLFYENMTLDEPGLQIPHPRMCERGFVMMPLAQIAPEREIAGHTVRHWAQQLYDPAIHPICDDRDWWRMLNV